MPSFEDIVTHVGKFIGDADPSCDIKRLAPEITQADALRIQLAWKRKLEAAGDRIIGHQASFTSTGVRKLFPDSPNPMVGTLLRSLARDDGEEIEMAAERCFVEAEVALILKRDLEGPDLTDREVLSAIDSFLPSIEIAPLRPGPLALVHSYEHMIAVQKAPGGFVFFGQRTTATKGIDLRLEGCLVSLDGEPKVGATGFEAMGSPLKVVAAMARKMHEIGEKLHEGQVLMTGSLPQPPIMTHDHRVARAEFATLGGVTVRLAGK